MNEDFVQQLARLVEDELDDAWHRADLSRLIVQTVLASGLVVPTSDVHDAIGRAEARGMSSAVRELRALTQQEPQ